MVKDCPAKLKINCQECFAEKERLCDFPYCGKTNIYDIITKVYFRDLKEVDK